MSAKCETCNNKNNSVLCDRCKQCNNNRLKNYYEPIKKKSNLDWNKEDYINFIFTVLISQSFMWTSLIMGYKTGFKYYNWTIITMLIFFGILIFKNRFDIEKLQKQIREKEEKK